MSNYSSVMPSMAETIEAGKTKFCATCGYHNPADAGLCLNCSGPLANDCPVCGQPVPAGSKFCGQCGSAMPDNQSLAAARQRADQVRHNLRALMPTTLANKISAASGQILGEHREVTVLLASITSLADGPDKPDDEDIYFCRDEALRLLVEVVYKYEGTVDKFTGQGLVALFGAPVTHENDAERALRAALEMQTVFQPWRSAKLETHGLDFQARVGLNTGLVIAGKVGNDLHMEYTVVGETLNLATHLEAQAEPGTVLASAETYRRTRMLFEFEPLPPLSVAWLPEPVRSYQPLRLLDKPRWDRKWAGPARDMIGRTAELARLEAVLAEARQQKQNRVALVTGEAGVGKSRLVAEFRRRSSQAEARVYQGSCLTYARSTPLWIVAELLRDILQLSETDPDAVQHAAIQRYLEQLDLARPEIIPYLSHVLGLEQTDPRLEARVCLIDAAMLQRQTHAALRQVLLAEARLAPTVLIFEDLHSLDPASRDFLEYLIHTTTDAPLFIVLVSRQAERVTVLRPLLAAIEKGPTPLLDLPLQALAEADARRMVDQLITQSTTNAWMLKHQIVERAGGNPFYIEEITRMLFDQGGLIRDAAEGTLQVTSQANALLRAVPDTVKGLILTRFDRLPEHLRFTLHKAAILGTSFPVSLIDHLKDVAAETLTAQLEQLTVRQFLRAEPFRSEPGYIFQHALVQETIYNTLLRRDRGKIHLRVAEAIETSRLWPAEERAEALAFHYAKSTSPVKAIPHLITAAENAARRCAYETTIQHYRRASNLLPEQPEDDSDAMFKVGLGLGSALKFAGQFAAAAQVLTETLQRLWRWNLASEAEVLQPILVEGLCQLADVRQREGSYDAAVAYLEVGLQLVGQERDPAQLQPRYALLDRMAWIRFRQGQLNEALALANEATSGVNHDLPDNPSRLARVYNTLGGISWQRGQFDEAITAVQRSLQLYESIGYLWGMAIAYGNLGVLYYARGNWPQAADYYERAYTMQQIIGNPEGQGHSSDNLGILHTAMGDHEAARQALAAALTIRQRLGDTWGTAQSHANLAHLSALEGRYDEALTHAETALRLADQIGSSEIQVEARRILGLVQADQGQLSTGLKSVEQALDMARSTGLVEKETDCLRALGMLQAQAGRHEEAEALLLNSIDLAQKQNDPYRQGLALFETGQVNQQLAEAEETKREKAKTAFNQALAIFERLGAAYDLRRVQAARGQT